MSLREEHIEELGQAIDGVDNLAHALMLPFRPDKQVEVLRTALPEKVKALKAAFVKITGENPWDFDL